MSMLTYYSDKEYEGDETIVVAMDIGTTHSAVSFAYSTPGSTPCGQMVAQWPGQAPPKVAKTLSIVSYKDGKLKHCGAEALEDFEEDEGNVAYWFKLHVHPASASSSQKFEIPALPTGITIEQVYADLMKYLMGNTQRFFERTIPNGAEIWARVRDTIVILLATPNEWDIREQSTLRKAAIRASLVTEEHAERLVQFVTESEASVHYALAQTPGTWLEQETIFAVVDCGGSTVDTAVYRCVSTSPLELAETCPSLCVQAGGVFVDRQAEKMLKEKLKESSFSDPAFIKSMLDYFEKELKPKFDGELDTYTIKFGMITDNDPSLGIHKGNITLSTQELKQIFDDVIDKIVKSCSKTLIDQKAEYVLLVGGFAESPYLRKVLSKKLSIQTIMVGEYEKKAAAEGAIFGHIKHFVVARAARVTFGGCVRENYNRNLHGERRHAVQVFLRGYGLRTMSGRTNQ